MRLREFHERSYALNQFVDEAAQAPPVDWLAVTLAQKHFWGQVLKGTAYRNRVVVPSNSLLGETEVGQLRIAIIVNNNIFRL